MRKEVVIIDNDGEELLVREACLTGRVYVHTGGCGVYLDKAAFRKLVTLGVAVHGPEVLEPELEPWELARDAWYENSGQSTEVAFRAVVEAVESALKSRSDG